MSMIPNLPIEKISRLHPSQKDALDKLGLKTAKDLLFYMPARYTTPGQIKFISDLTGGEQTTIYGKIVSIKTKKGFKSKIPMAEGTIQDDTGKIKLIWFHQAYMAKKFIPETFVEIQGNVSKDKNGHLYITNPLIKETGQMQIATPNSLFKTENLSLIPIYSESKGISSLWIHQTIKKILENGVHKEIIDPIPEEILKKYNLPSLKDALVFIHAPQKENDALVAQKRFAFEEIFFIQLHRQKYRKEYQKNPSFVINDAHLFAKEFIKSLTFKPTGAQLDAIKQILDDMSEKKPMTRLLEGDVGSGKTIVAAAAAYATVLNRPKNQDFGNLEVAYMAPTEILAKQHFESFIKYFENISIKVGLITGSGCYKFPSKTDKTKPTKISRNQLLKWVANGEIPIVVGTHALIQEKVKFKNLALVIIDEQHRFGIKQRGKLANKTSKEKNIVPHLLSMTATPIPRTLALTIYGDLDISIIDQMPSGRKKIITKVVLPTGRESVYDHVKEEIRNGRQAYIICPRIDEPDPNKEAVVNARSVKAEAERLKKHVFTNQRIDILHSKMTPTDKDRVMKKFSDGEIDILISTSVVEVGVNVPNATMIIIEGAERFGLSQLHQLRGRVLRSNHQAHCYLFTESKTEKTIKRLSAITTAKNGFELSELDLLLRGPGELSGKKQWGLSDLAMEAIKNIKMVEAARTEASHILEEDSSLKKYPPIFEKIKEMSTEKVHLE